MYGVMLAVKSRLLLQELDRLHIWGDSTGFQVREITSDFEHLIAKLKETKYHLVLLEDLPDYHIFSLLRLIKKENLCQAVAVVSESADIKSVRKGFLSGADDFFVTPLEISQFITLFGKIEHEENGRIAEEICRKEEVLNFFEHVDFSMQEWLDDLFYRTLSEYRDPSEAAIHLKRILESVVSDLFERYEWLKYYFVEEDFLSANYDILEDEDKIKKVLDDFHSFFSEFSELYPPHRDGIDKILLYILNRPEGDLKQKTVSEELYMNRSYLSTVFSAQIGINFVDYINTVKMKRAAYLLKHTKMKIIDIAGLLDYKDMGYFLKKFKTKYGMTPSQYRIPETYEFQI